MAELLHDCDHTRLWALLRRSGLELVANIRAFAVIRTSISPVLRRRIVILAQQGLSTAEIAKRVHRGEVAVTKVIAEELDYVERLRAQFSVQLGPQVERLIAQMETRCRRECYEEAEVA